MWGNGNEDAIIILFPGAEPREVYQMVDSYVVDLGDGYSLWLYTVRADGSLGTVLALVMRVILFLPIAIISTFLIMLIIRYKKAKAESLSI